MSSPGATIQEYSIRVPKNVKKNFKVMRFNSSVNVDFTKWSQVKMERENNMKEYRGLDEEQPKFGAGSEFGRDAREEARRRKYGINTKKYRPEDQPWILKIGGKTGKKFRGTREGGVAENASYYVFTHGQDGVIEAFPIQEWYNFQPTQRYKALSAEEAELEFSRRNKQVNYFSLMLRKRLRGDEEAETEEGEEAGKLKSKTKGKKGELKISEMDDWIDSDDEKGSESGEEKESDEEEKEKKKKKEDPKKKKKKDPLDEAFEESDDGDEEGREVDYISDSSDSVSDHEAKASKELKGVAEEDALRKLLSSGEEDEDEEDKEKEEGKDSEGEDKQKAEGAGGTKEDKEKKSKKKKHEKKKKDDGIVNDSSSDMSSDSSDSETDNKKKHSTNKSQKEPSSAASSRSVTPTKDTTGPESNKRKSTIAIEQMMNKKARLDNFASASVPTLSLGSNDSGITEDAVRRYLMRKPMTTTELLQKFKSKKTGLTSEQLVNIMTQILKRINPVKQTIKGKMYLSIKA
ncbi:general transcription factor IIF subunit 1 [Schistocerca americana]|uniref:general transcription factor IIF subunit 1 n=1 Tax=Schistocerca americana TaxID=7009 RepID=UPI001F4F64B7|nr:general transcription factor IIF subunit 1 [Schistocerca americana]XP_046999451.1 general transcription factor IIF subunit 1 [Schistocerca americana]XP_049963758.1 general transcription factor IIF subunit 1 [Schistocerca serialis cubense]XP_049963759.1 general transcription factor IIF subunit 1 [Schistocerca serialis cubense]